MARSFRQVALGLMFGLAATSVGLAQYGGMGGRSQSAFSGGGMGSNLGGMSGMSSRMGGGMGGGLGSSFGGSSFGNSGFGSTSFGQSGFGNSGFGGTQFGSSGMGSGMGGGVGGQNFVGRDSGDMNAVMNQMGRAGTQFFNSMNQNMGRRNNRNRNQQPAAVEDSERPPVRIRLQVAFTPPRPAPSAVAANVQARLARLAVDHSVGNPQVAMEGGTVVLRGIAETESQRRVLEKLIAMEPGVTAVRNEMVVVPPPIEAVQPVAAE